MYIVLILSFPPPPPHTHILPPHHSLCHPRSLYVGDEISAATATTDIFAYQSSPSHTTTTTNTNDSYNYNDPHNPHIHGSAVICQWGCRALNNLSKSKALRAKLVNAGAKGLLDRVLKRYSQYSDVVEEKGVWEWASVAREGVEGKGV